jgi:lysophospholipase L1-like esterase
MTDRGARRIVWMPPVSSDPNRYEEKDQALIAAAGHGLAILDWPQRVATNQQWFGFDGVHLTTDGYIAMATFITDEIWRFRS